MHARRLPPPPPAAACRRRRQAPLFRSPAIAPSCREAHEGPLTFDLGNLTAWDASAPDPAAFAAGTDAACHTLAQSIFQTLAARLFALPSEAAPVGRVASLPAPTTVLPREKPIPKPKPPTKWEIFAQVGAGRGRCCHRHLGWCRCWRGPGSGHR